MGMFPCFRFSLILAAAVFAEGCGYVHHVPPGQSIAFSMAKKADLVAKPPEPQPEISSKVQTAGAAAVPSPALPEQVSETERVADKFTLGNLCMEQGRYAEAITAYEAALQINPNFADAWSKLAVAYQNTGQDKKALEAFRKYKTVSVQ
jgi:tetratricopeptide (TPR) repeat protein